MSTPFPIFDYTSGDIDNLVGGEDASMADIQGPFIDLRAFLNSGVLQTLAQGLLYIGEVRHIAVPNAPALWLPCDGAAVSRATYSKLFAAIGTTYGAGDGVNTFAVPDLRGRAALGAGQGASLTNRAAGAKGGSEAANMPSHAHGGGTGNNLQSLDHNHGEIRLAIPGFPILAEGGFAGEGAGTTGGASFGAGIHQHGIGAEGGGNTVFGQPVDNMPPFTAIPAYIYAGA